MSEILTVSNFVKSPVVEFTVLNRGMWGCVLSIIANITNLAVINGLSFQRTARLAVDWVGCVGACLEQWAWSFLRCAWQHSEEADCAAFAGAGGGQDAQHGAGV